MHYSVLAKKGTFDEGDNNSVFKIIPGAGQKTELLFGKK